MRTAGHLSTGEPQGDPWQGALGPSTPSYSAAWGTCIRAERGGAMTGSECHCQRGWKIDVGAGGGYRLNNVLLQQQQQGYFSYCESKFYNRK